MTDAPEIMHPADLNNIQFRIKNDAWYFEMSIYQPRSQGFSLWNWEGREKTLASAGHVILLFPPLPISKGKALGTSLVHIHFF